MTTQTTLKPSDPGLSLWLVPPPNSSIHQNLTKAITHTVPQALNSSNPVPLFEPHLTLTSRIPRQTITDDPQKWLDEIKLPPIPEAVVSFKEVAVGDAYFKKLFIRCKRDEALLRLARACRVHSSKGDGEEEYDPHVSLVYSNDSVSEDERRLVEGELAKDGVSVDGKTDRGWEGGDVWLVATDGDVAGWHPIARRN